MKLKESMNSISEESVDDVIAAQIIEHQNSEEYEAFFVGNIGDMICKYKLWKSLLPRVHPFYAVKCNDDVQVLSTLAQLGTGFDCASKAEIQKVLALGIGADRIIYANPCKQGSHIKYACKNKVKHMTFDNENELHKIKEIHPDAKMVLRILPPRTDKVKCDLGIKYGCQPRHAAQLLRVAKQLNVQVVGVSFHVGSGCYDLNAFALAVEIAHQVFQLAEAEGFKFTLLDIGGGFPGTANVKLSFPEIAETLRASLDHYFPEESGVQLIAEPGRFFVASAYTLAVSLIASRKIMDEDTGEETYMHYMNDGVYGSFNCILFENAEVHAILPDESKYEGQLRYKSSLWGPTCDGLDCVIKECSLPRLATKDWLLFRDMGAYTMAAASNFNGMPKPVCYYVIQDAFKESIKSASQSSPSCLLSYHQQSFLEPCPIVMRTGHVLSELGVMETLSQTVEI